MGPDFFFIVQPIREVNRLSGSRMRILAFITSPDNITRILDHLKFTHPPSPARYGGQAWMSHHKGTVLRQNYVPIH